MPLWLTEKTKSHMDECLTAVKILEKECEAIQGKIKDLQSEWDTKKKIIYGYTVLYHNTLARAEVEDNREQTQEKSK